MTKVDHLPVRLRSKFVVRDGDCWPWMAAVGANGYGHIYWAGRVQEAHRVVYELLVGPIPPDLVVDHRCHNEDVDCRGGRCAHRLCQNPDHLQLVKRGRNVLSGAGLAAVNSRKTRCENGHEYTDETMVIDGGTRRCLICARAVDRARRPAGVPRKGRASGRPFHPRTATPETIARDAEIVRLRESGLSFAAIARELGVSVSHAHKRYGIATRRT